ncbi:hypothetical protein SKAU_G00410890, partial [Synaphobranchus kaupii]
SLSAVTSAPSRPPLLLPVSLLPSPLSNPSLNSPSTASDTLLTALSTSLNSLCPLVSRPTRPSPPCLWMSDALRTSRAGLRAAERMWRKSREASGLSSYQSLLVAFSTAVTAAKNNLLDPHQSGFKPGHSTETAVLSVSEMLHAAWAASPSSVLILLDLSAAFDTVDHSILLSSLSAAGIGGSALAWIESYLSERSSQVTWAGKVSAPRPLTTGLPQDSVLGPLLFSTYTKSLGPVITAHGLSYHCYADDTQLFLSFSPSDTQVSARISACLRDIQSWMDNHHLKLNPGKTELIYIPALTSPPLNLSISLGDTPLTPTPCARNLGVVMDNRLSLSENIAVVTRVCRFLLYNIRRIRPFLTIGARLPGSPRICPSIPPKAHQTLHTCQIPAFRLLRTTGTPPPPPPTSY